MPWLANLRNRVQTAFGAVRLWVGAHPHLTILGGATAFSLLTPFVVPALLSAVGFGAGGVVAGSFAAVIHALIGNVAAGSLFALCQAIGAGAAVPLLGYIATGVGAGAVIETLRTLMRTALAARIAAFVGRWSTHVAGLMSGWAGYVSIMARTMRVVARSRMGMGGAGFRRLIQNVLRRGGRPRND